MKSATRLAKGDVGTEVTDAAVEAKEADMNVKAEAAGEVAVADAVQMEAEDTVKNTKKPLIGSYRQLLRTTKKPSTRC